MGHVRHTSELVQCVVRNVSGEAAEMSEWLRVLMVQP